MKRVISVFVFILSLSTILFGGIQYNLEEFQDNGLSSQFSLVDHGGKRYARFGLSPNLAFGPLGVGVDLNLFMPTEGDAVPSDLSSVVLRRVSYDHQDQAGFTWGRLQKVNFGYGLLMDDYDSGSFGSTVFTNEKAGVLAYGTYQNVRVDGMMTASKVNGVRASYTLEESLIMGSPVVFGVNYVKDTDGISDIYDGKSIQREAQEGYGLDIGVPIAGDFLTVYTEYAKLTDQGQGMSAGFKGSLFGQFDYRAEYRTLGERFAPGYYNGLYEATSFDFSTDSIAEKTSGYLVSGGTSFMEDLMKAGLMYENYDNIDPIWTAAAGWKRMNNTAGVVNYKKVFGRAGLPGILTADILYYTGQLLDYVIHYKRIYLSDGTFTESWAAGVQMNLDSFVPKLPFIQ